MIRYRTFTLKTIHLNDSIFGLGSRKDRHARIGEGKIGREGIVRIINHPALRNLPFYLETPNDLEGYGKEISFYGRLDRTVKKGYIERRSCICWNFLKRKEGNLRKNGNIINERFSVLNSSEKKVG